MTRYKTISSGMCAVLCSLACAGSDAPSPGAPDCVADQVECRGQQLWTCRAGSWMLTDDCGAKNQFCTVDTESPPPWFGGSCTSFQAACPFVDVETDQGWLTVGEILRNLNRPALYGSQSLVLPPEAIRDGRVTLKLVERKEEVTHLDALWLEIDGRRVLPAGCDGLECAVDGRWIDLHPGEERTWIFPTPPRARAVTLWAHGYYTPLAR